MRMQGVYEVGMTRVCTLTVTGGSSGVPPRGGQSPIPRVTNSARKLTHLAGI